MKYTGCIFHLTIFGNFEKLDGDNFSDPGLRKGFNFE